MTAHDDQQFYHRLKKKRFMFFSNRKTAGTRCLSLSGLLITYTYGTSAKVLKTKKKNSTLSGLFQYFSRRSLARGCDPGGLPLSAKPDLPHKVLGAALY